MPVIMHIDMDAFYASVELKRHPELRGRPMWVGGASRGVVLSASYEARAFGVEGGMSSTRARRLCPDAVAIAPDFDLYAATSAGVFRIFESITPLVEPMSLDEAFLDITGSRRSLGEPTQVGETIRALVADEQGIGCSVGIGPTKFIAKLASSAAKPNGLCEVHPVDVIAFLHPLAVEKMWGVGEATKVTLNRLGLYTVGDLAHTPRATVQAVLGPTVGGQLHDLAWGIDARRVVAPDRERSVGSQETFAKDTDDPRVIHDELLRVCERVAARLRGGGVLGRTVTVHVRFADFRVLQRSTTLRSPTDSTGELHAAALTGLRGMRLDRPRLRRVGVRVEHLVDAEHAYLQPTLDAPAAGWREAERAADAAVARFGPRAVQRATLATRRRA